MSICLSSPAPAKVGWYWVLLLCIYATYNVPHPLTINFPLVLSEGTFMPSNAEGLAISLLASPALQDPTKCPVSSLPVYKLAAECQALGIKLAKKFQVLSSLEAIHHNSIQGMVHETLTMGHSAHEATCIHCCYTGPSS